MSARGELALKLEPLLRAKAKEHQRGGQGGVLLSTDLSKANTREALAKTAGLSEGTIDKVRLIAQHAA